MFELSTIKCKHQTQYLFCVQFILLTYRLDRYLSVMYVDDGYFQRTYSLSFSDPALTGDTKRITNIVPAVTC